MVKYFFDMVRTTIQENFNVRKSDKNIMQIL